MKGRQFKFNFSETMNNSFKNSLNNGEFNIFFEVNIPEVDCNIKTALNRCTPFVKSVEKIEDLNCGVAIANGKKHRKVLNAVDFASELEFKDANRHVIFISGRGKTAREVYETYDASVRTGIKNIIPVTGEYYTEERVKDVKSIKFFESVRALSILKEHFLDMSIFPGATINPFKYTPIDLYPQYFNLMKKIKLGANYIFTQTGWDLLKFQELRWYLEKRNLYVPTIAKFYFLKPDYIEEVISGSIPGVRISPDFLATLRKEARFGLTQFMSAQWRKLQLMLGGVKFMGYSGVMIAGLESSTEVNVAQLKIKEAFKEFSSFEDWKIAYAEYLARAEMAPYPYRFYMYSNLFEEAYADNAKEAFIKVPDCNRKEKIQYLLSKCLWKRKTEPGKKPYLRSLIYKCSSCRESKCTLQTQFYNCYKKCPKNMVNGPCGDTNADGSCDMTEEECIFGKIFRVASWKRKIDKLEDEIL
jgi:methylenetetrahydrofolate reductase (NADPH)